MSQQNSVAERGKSWIFLSSFTIFVATIFSVTDTIFPFTEKQSFSVCTYCKLVLCESSATVDLCSENLSVCV